MTDNRNPDDERIDEHETVTIEVPERIEHEARRRAAANDGDLEAAVLDHFELELVFTDPVR